MTLGMSHCREPIGEAQVILSPMQLPIGANRHPIPTGDFLRFCPTNPTADEVTFAEEASTTFGWDLEPHRLDAFKTLIGKEKNCIALFLKFRKSWTSCSRWDSARASSAICKPFRPGVCLPTLSSVGISLARTSSAPLKSGIPSRTRRSSKKRADASTCVRKTA